MGVGRCGGCWRRPPLRLPTGSFSVAAHLSLARRPAHQRTLRQSRQPGRCGRPPSKGLTCWSLRCHRPRRRRRLLAKKINKKTDRGKETRRGKNHSKRSTLYRSSAAPHRYVLLFTSCTSRGRASRTRHAFRTHAPPSRPATSHTHHYQGLRWINPCPIYPPVIVTSIFFVASVRALLF